jgi:hypothetical protein
MCIVQFASGFDASTNNGAQQIGTGEVNDLVAPTAANRCGIRPPFLEGSASNRAPRACKVLGASYDDLHIAVVIICLKIWIQPLERTAECFVENGNTCVEERLTGPAQIVAIGPLSIACAYLR